MLKAALVVAFLASASFASEGIYDRDLVRGYIALKSGLYSMKSNGVRFINEATGEKYNKEYLGAQAEIGAEYLQFRTWFDINFMPLTPTRGNTEWFSYGVTWMWGYKLLKQNSIFNIIPSIGPGVELQTIRLNNYDPHMSTFGPTLNLELELRLQASQFSAGVYGGYKVTRFDGWDAATAARENVPPLPYNHNSTINSDKAFVGLKLSWTMLNNFQRKEKDLR